MVVGDYRSLHISLQQASSSAVLVVCRVIASEAKDDCGPQRIWELNTSELTGFFEDVTYPFFIVGSDGYILWLNRIAHEDLGYMREEMLNHRMEDVSFFTVYMKSTIVKGNSLYNIYLLVLH